MKITIDESKWGPSYLLNPSNGDMCCIGQAAEQVGHVGPADLSGRTMMSVDELGLDERLDSGSHDLQRWTADLTGYRVGDMFEGNHSMGARRLSCLAYLNDAYHRESSKGQREEIKKALVSGFAEAGYEIEFA